MFEQVPLLLRHVALVVAIAVRILQHMSASCDFIYGVRQKDQFDLWVAFQFMQKSDLRLDHFFHFVRKAFTFMVVVVSLEVEDVFLEFKFGVFSCLILCCDFCVVETVAFIITSSALVVLLPFTQADPAKLCVAHFALHVIAPLVLLDRLATFCIWTLFGIRNYPIDILRFT